MQRALSATLGAVEANGAQVVKVSGDPAAAAAVLNRSATVEYAEPNLDLHTLGVPNDARFGELYGLSNPNNSSLAICRALNAAGSGTTSGVANCITYLAGNGVKVISMSLGGGASTTLQSAVTKASKTSLIIAAAGNDGDATLNYPAAYSEVVSVAATDSNDARASFSNANADVEIAAAGVNVLSTKRGGGYVAFSGTSMATPHVSGVAALIAAKNPSFTPAQIRAKLDTSVDDKGAAGRDPQFGFGRVNLAKALS